MYTVCMALFDAAFTDKLWLDKLSVKSEGVEEYENTIDI